MFFLVLPLIYCETSQTLDTRSLEITKRLRRYIFQPGFLTSLTSVTLFFFLFSTFPFLSFLPCGLLSSSFLAQSAVSFLCTCPNVVFPSFSLFRALFSLSAISFLLLFSTPVLLVSFSFSFSFLVSFPSSYSDRVPRHTPSPSPSLTHTKCQQ